MKEQRQYLITVKDREEDQMWWRRLDRRNIQNNKEQTKTQTKE
jgi:hypothetical protein